MHTIKAITNIKSYLGTICLCILMSCLHLTLQAQVTLDKCKELSRKNYPAIRQFSLIEKAREYSLKNAALSWVPKVTIGLEGTIQNNVPTLPDKLNPFLKMANISSNKMQKGQYKGFIDINQTIWDGGKSKTDRDIARFEALENKAEVETTLYEVESKIEELYFSILLIDNGIKQTNGRLALLNSNYDKILSYVKNGIAMTSDADAIEAEILSVKQGLLQLKSSRLSYIHMLGLFTGQNLENEEFELPSLPSRLNSNDCNRPEIEYFNACINKSNAQSKLLDVAIMPKIGLFAQTFYGYPGFDYFNSIMSKDLSFNAIAGIRLVWDISPFTTRKVRKAEISTAKEKIMVQKETFLFNMNLQSESQNIEISRLKNLLIDDDKIIELRTNIRKAEESKLQNGVIDITDLLAKITAEHDAVMNKNNHEIELLRAAYALKHINNTHSNE